MNGKTHIAGGMALASLTSLLLSGSRFIEYDHLFLQQATILTSAGLGALWLDIDHKNSTISKSHPVLSFLLRLFLTHRGASHSLLAFFLLALLSFVIAKVTGAGNGDWIAYGASVGYASHILLDSLNPSGVPLLFPFIKRKFHFAHIVTGSKGEKAVYTLIILVTVISEAVILGIYEF